MSYKNNNKAWAPQPMRTASMMAPGTFSTSSKSSKTKFLGDMAKNAPGSDNIYGNPVVGYSENGATLYATTGHALLDLNTQLTSLRQKSEQEIIAMFRKAYAETPTLAMRWLFYAGDVREGAGERRTFKIILKDIATCGGSQMVSNLVQIIPEFTRWDMLYTLLDITDGRIYKAVSELIKDQWSKDIQGKVNGQPISLMAKWLKSANSRNPQTRKYGLQTARILGLTETYYRKYLSMLRNYLEVVETRMSSNNWQAIDYEKVPSKANLIYNKAFFRHDEDRRQAYLNALTKGEAKINSSVLFPHEIVHKYWNNCGYSYTSPDAALEAMWASLPDLIQGAGDTLVVCDDSSSMFQTVANTTAKAMEIAFALSIYFAERNVGPYQNMVMTFSHTPRLRKLPNGTLKDKVDYMRSHSEVANTNIEAVFDLILQTAIQNGYSQKDLPSRILILSDGEFDAMTRSYSRGMGYSSPDKTLFEEINNRFKRNGFTMPKLVFWNICGRSNTFPFSENSGFPCVLVSGFSTNIFKMVCSSKDNPWDALVEQLMVKRYDVVESLAFPKAKAKARAKQTSRPTAKTTTRRSSRPAAKSKSTAYKSKGYNSYR